MGTTAPTKQTSLRNQSFLLCFEAVLATSFYTECPIAPPSPNWTPLGKIARL